MLKLTKTGIGLLTRQYRSVLKKCLLINLGMFTLSMVILPRDASAENIPNYYKKSDTYSRNKIDNIQSLNIPYMIVAGWGRLLALCAYVLTAGNKVQSGMSWDDSFGSAKDAELRSEILAFARMTGKKEWSGMTGKEKRSGMTGKEKRSWMTGKEERSWMTGKEERSWMTGKEKQSGMAGNKSNVILSPLWASESIVRRSMVRIVKVACGSKDSDGAFAFSAQPLRMTENIKNKGLGKVVICNGGVIC